VPAHSCRWPGRYTELPTHTSAACPYIVSVFFVSSHRPPRSPLFPYTTLFRSLRVLAGCQSLVPPVRDPGAARRQAGHRGGGDQPDRKSTRLNSSHGSISYAVFCLKKKSRKAG